jgi:hypothetical protein
MIDAPIRLPKDVVALYGKKGSLTGQSMRTGFLTIGETGKPPTGSLGRATLGFTRLGETSGDTASSSRFRTLSQIDTRGPVPASQEVFSHVAAPQEAGQEQPTIEGDKKPDQTVSELANKIENESGEPVHNSADVYIADTASDVVASSRGKAKGPRARTQGRSQRRPDGPVQRTGGNGRVPPKNPPPPSLPSPDGDGEKPRKTRVDIDSFASGLEGMAAGIHQEKMPLEPRMYYGITQFVRRPPTIERFREFITNEATPDAIDFQIRAYTELMRGFGFSQADSIISAGMTASVDIGMRVAEAKNRTIGYEQTSAVSEAVITSIAERFAHRVVFQHYDELTRNIDPLYTITETANALLLENRYAANLAPNIQYYAAELNNGFNLAKHLESLSSAEEGVTHEQMRDANDKLFERTQLLQRYGVKSAIAPSILGGNVHEWLILDYDTEQEAKSSNNDEYGTNFGPMNYAGRHIALFVGTPGRFISSRADYKTNTGSRVGAKLTSLDLNPLLEEGSSPSTVVKLMQDGQLATNFGRPISEILEEAGAGMREYEILRGEILAIYADSVTPVTVSRIVEQEIEEQKPASQGGGSSERKPSLYPLVLARERVMDTLHEDIIEELERETRQPEKQTEQDGEREKRHMVEHEVKWHKRDINPRYRASPQARELAWKERGIVLAEYGETYVATHPRGDLPADSVKGHIVRRRQPSDARRIDDSI